VNPKTDKELYIEVKTTRFGIASQFYISPNEVNFSKAKSEQYSLYRVYDFDRKPRIFSLDGDITQYVHLQALSYRAYF